MRIIRDPKLARKVAKAHQNGFAQPSVAEMLIWEEECLQRAADSGGLEQLRHTEDAKSWRDLAVSELKKDKWENPDNCILRLKAAVDAALEAKQHAERLVADLRNTGLPYFTTLQGSEFNIRTGSLL